MPGYPSGTVTFLFTDIEQSTTLWERHAAKARAVVERHLAIIGEAVAANGGVHFKTIGDATQSAFPTAAQGVAAAFVAQRGLIHEPWPSEEERPRVRMALHAGAAEPQDGDYLAGSLNRLSRLLDTAHGGQVLLSQTVASLAGDALPDGATIKALGVFRLRDILQPEEIFQLHHPDLPADFPALNTPGQMPHNLPVHPTPFLGREREVEEIVTLLQRPDVRLVTLTGPGGVGKTRLGMQVAAEALESFPDGAFLVDLARQTDPDMVPSATAAALGVREQAGQPIAEQLNGFLRERRLILLFDNFEHVLAAATFVAELLASAPGLKVLATSRARLGLQAEHEYRVETMPIPDLEALPPLKTLSQYDAIKLFVSRAQALRPNFALSERNANAVAAIVCQLDGLPLAIELAAARVKLLSPEALLERLERRLPTLTGGARDLPERQRALRDTIAWSHELLTAEEQILFRRLSVFVGGWTMEGAEAVAAVEGNTAVDPLQALTGLVDQSLADERPYPGATDDEPRYAMLETIREYARERLDASDESDRVERAFEMFLLGRAREAEQGLRGSEQEAWLARLDAEHDNLRAALGREIERGDGVAALRLATRLRRFWWMHGHFGEGRSWLERALRVATSPEPALVASAEYALGELSALAGAYQEADTHFQTCIEIRRSLNDLPAVAQALGARANVAVNLRKFDEAQSLGEEALAIFREHGDVRGAAEVLYDLGLIARDLDDYDRARELFEESMDAWVALDDLAWKAVLALGLGITHRLAGKAEKASARLDEASALYRRLGDRFGIAAVDLYYGHLARDAGQVEEAISHYGVALKYFASIGDNEDVTYCLEALAISASLRDDAELALRLFGAADAARSTLALPPLAKADAREVSAGRDAAMQCAGVDAERHFAAGQALTLDQARIEALTLVDGVAQHAADIATQ